MTGLMEILGLEEYFKLKVILSLTNIGNGSQLKNPDIFGTPISSFQNFLLRWNQWGTKIGENHSICQSNNLHLTSRDHWVLQLLKVANLMRCSIRQYQAASNETLTGARGIDIFLLLKSFQLTKASIWRKIWSSQSLMSWHSISAPKPVLLELPGNLQKINDRRD